MFEPIIKTKLYLCGSGGRALMKLKCGIIVYMRLHHKLNNVAHFAGTLSNTQTTPSHDIARHQHLAVAVETAALTTGLQLMVSNDGTQFYYYDTFHLFEFDPSNHAGKYQAICARAQPPLPLHSGAELGRQPPARRRSPLSFLTEAH